MPKQIVTDEDFIAAWNELGSATLVSRKLGLTERTVMHRRSLIESKLNISLHAHNDQRFNRHIMHSENKIRSIADVTGSVVVFSDAHFMPNETSTAFNALIKVISGRLKDPIRKTCGASITEELEKAYSKYWYRDWETDRKSTRLNSSH